jgi:hypothetical protein
MPMATLTAADWLVIWDMAEQESALDRSHRIAAAAYPDDDVAADTPGRRNKRLLSVLLQLGNRRIACVTTCSNCETLLDLDLDAVEISDLYRDPPDTVCVEHQGAQFRFRLPSLRDFAAVVDNPTGEGPLVLLARRCLVNGDTAQVTDPLLIEALSIEYDRADPLGHVSIELQCPQCAGRNTPAIDVGALLWNEIDVMATVLMRDVHMLASAYGWRENDILAMSTQRRRRYVAMVQP